MIKFFHIVEHYPPGTIYNLIKPLTNYNNHKLFLLKNKDDITRLKESLIEYDDYIVILHCTGRLLPIFSNLRDIIKNNKIYIYMHVSYKYLKYNKRYKAIKILKELSNDGIIMLVPSKVVANEYNKNSIKSIVVRPGIDKITIRKKHDLSNYYNKIITTCTESNKIYFKVKGIDKLKIIMNNKKLKDKLLIVGTNTEIIKGFNSIKLSHSDFLDVLQHSLAYIQLSRFECYNITAVEAKQLKIPIILSKVEGHYDSCFNGFLTKNAFEAKKKMIDVIEGEYDKKIIENNYIDSLKYESLESFNNEFLKLEDYEYFNINGK